MKDLNDFNEFMKKVDYLVRINPTTIRPPLSQLGKPSIKSSYKFLSKEKARQALLELPKEEVERLYDEEIKRQIAQSEAEEKARYFNQSYCDADFYHWGRQAYWTIEEGIILILGKDPRKVDWEKIKQYAHVSSFVRKFEEIRELAKRYVSCEQLTSSLTPGIFLAWVQRMDYPLPEKLQEVVNALGIQIADWQKLYDQAIELLNEKDKIIQMLEFRCERLKADYEVLKKNPHQMDEESDNYAPELDAANIIYRAIINNSDKSIPFKKHAVKLTNKLYPKFSEEAKKRITAVINTIKGKNGGRERNI